MKIDTNANLEYNKLDHFQDYNKYLKSCRSHKNIMTLDYDEL